MAFGAKPMPFVHACVPVATRHPDPRRPKINKKLVDSACNGLFCYRNNEGKWRRGFIGGFGKTLKIPVGAKKEILSRDGSQGIVSNCSNRKVLQAGMRTVKRISREDDHACIGFVMEQQFQAFLSYRVFYSKEYRNFLIFFYFQSRINYR